MKQVFIHGPGDVRLDESVKPEPGPRDVVVRVAACGICGSDLGYVKLGGLIGPSSTPMPIGHELSGVVAEIGSEVANLDVGTRVVLNPTAAGNMIGNGGPEGGFAPYLLVRNAADGGSLFSIPDDLGDEQAALAEPLAVGINAVDRAEIGADSKVVVFGAGPIGLSVIATLNQRGVAHTIAVDLSDYRLDIAHALGADEVINPTSSDVWSKIRELHGTSDLFGSPMVSTDVYVEVSGVTAVMTSILHHSRRDAQVVVVALHRRPVEVDFMVVMMKQLRILGAAEYPDDFSIAIDMLRERDLSVMITHTFPLDDFPNALGAAQDPHLAGKVVITMR